MKICLALLETAFFALATSKPLLSVFRQVNNSFFFVLTRLTVLACFDP
jgi:hypothetical protein